MPWATTGPRYCLPSMVMRSSPASSRTRWRSSVASAVFPAMSFCSASARRPRLGGVASEIGLIRYLTRCDSTAEQYQNESGDAVGQIHGQTREAADIVILDNPARGTRITTGKSWTEDRRENERFDFQDRPRPPKTAQGRQVADLDQPLDILGICAKCAQDRQLELSPTGRVINPPLQQST